MPDIPARQIVGSVAPTLEIAVPMTVTEDELRRQLQEAVDRWVTEALALHQGESRKDVSLVLGGTARELHKEFKGLTLDEEAAAHLARIEASFRGRFIVMNARTRRTLAALLARRDRLSTPAELALATGYAQSSMLEGVKKLKESFKSLPADVGQYAIQGIPSTGWRIVVPPLTVEGAAATEESQ